MEYVQMTLNDWVEMKKKLRQELLGVKQSFVRIGYVLRQIDDQKLYEQDGYKSIAEFAKEEYGLEPSTTSRFMSINREYSIDGYSDQLRPEFNELGRSQLEEMLKLPESDRAMIQSETSREDIRDLKRFNKSEPAAGVADDLRQLIEKFFQDNKEILNTVFSEPVFDETTIKRFAEIVNPGGNRSYKKGLYFLMMYENRVAVKKFGAGPQDLTWWEFWQITLDIFGEAAAGHQTWQNYFGGADEDEQPNNTEGNNPGIEEENGERAKNNGGTDGEESVSVSEKTEKTTTRDHETVDHAGKADSKTDTEGKGKSREDYQESTGRTDNEPIGAKSQRKEIAPAQKATEILDEKASDENTKEIDSWNTDTEIGELETEKVEPEETKSGFAAMNPPEIMEKPFGRRKDWFDTLTAYGIAVEMANLMRTMLKENLADMTDASFWESWLNEEVDDQGRTIEEA